MGEGTAGVHSQKIEQLLSRRQSKFYWGLETILPLRSIGWRGEGSFFFFHLNFHIKNDV